VNTLNAIDATYPLVRTLASHQVRDVLTGSVAALLYGRSDSRPNDRDIVPHTEPDNLLRLLAALTERSAGCLTFRIGTRSTVSLRRRAANWTSFRIVWEPIPSSCNDVSSWMVWASPSQEPPWKICWPGWPYHGEQRMSGASASSVPGSSSTPVNASGAWIRVAENAERQANNA